MADLRLRTLLWSASLIAGGTVLLLFNLGVLDAYAPIPQVGLAAACAVAAVVFFVSFARARQEWWRLLPAWTLTALTGMSLTIALPGFDRALIAAQIFVGLALAFGHIYLLERTERWWAIIPGGFMLVLGIVVGLSSRINSTELLAALLFVGLGLVFFLLYLLDGRRRQWWALIPGSVLVICGMFAWSAGRVEEDALLRWWPIALIAIGTVVGLRARSRPAPEKLQINRAPKAQTNSAPAADRPATSGPRSALGDYSQPAPGASVEILSDRDDLR